MEHNAIGRWRVVGVIRSLINAMRHCLHLFLCMAVRQCYGRKKERFRVKAVQMDNLRGLLGIRRMDRVPNAQIRKLLWSEERSR